MRRCSSTNSACTTSLPQMFRLSIIHRGHCNRARTFRARIFRLTRVPGACSQPDSSLCRLEEKRKCFGENEMSLPKIMLQNTLYKWVALDFDVSFVFSSFRMKFRCAGSYRRFFRWNIFFKDTTYYVDLYIRVQRETSLFILTMIRFILHSIYIILIIHNATNK